MAIQLTDEDRTEIAAIRKRLGVEFKNKGRGSQGRVLTVLGMQKGTLDAAFSRGSIKLFWILKIVRQLGRKPRDFFLAAFGNGDHTQDLPDGRPPEGVRRVRERVEKGLPAEGDPISPERLEDLDMLRQDDPKSANFELEEALQGSPLELLPKILLVYGGTFRQLGRLSDARWSYYEGARIARQFGDLQMEAAFQQRRSWVELADGKPLFALSLLRNACGICCELGKGNEQGEVLTDIAAQYFARGMLEKGKTAANSSLALLDLKNTRFRFCAYQVLALTSKDLGDQEMALEYADRAKEAALECPRSWQVRAEWMDARIKQELLGEEEVAKTLLAAANFFLELGEILDASLAFLEYASTQASLGNFDEVARIAESLGPLAFKIEGEFFAGILLEIKEQGAKARLTKEGLEFAVKMFKRGGAAAPLQRTTSHWG